MLCAETRLRGLSLNYPRPPILRRNQRIRVRRVRLLLFAVPVDVVAEADGEHAGKSDLGEMAAEIEIAPRLPLTFDRVDPFLHVADVARERLRNRFGRLMPVDVHELHVIVQLDLDGVVPRIGPDDPFLADEQAAMLGRLSGGGDDVLEDLSARMAPAVVPVDRDSVELAIRIALLARGEMHLKMRGFGVALLGEAFALDLDLAGVGEIERAKGGVEDVAGEIGDRAAAEIKPIAPACGMVKPAEVGAVG